MEKIIFSALLRLPELLAAYALTDYKLVDLSVGRDEQVSLRIQDTNLFHKTVCYLDGQSKAQVGDIIVQYGFMAF